MRPAAALYSPPPPNPVLQGGARQSPFVALSSFPPLPVPRPLALYSTVSAALRSRATSASSTARALTRSASYR
jgi:hypothetical protein